MSRFSKDIFYQLEGKEKDECPVGYANRCLALWMSFLEGKVKVVDTVIPGSHDSATYSMREVGNIGDAYAKTQDYNLTAQLLSGIRYLDLRCKMKDNSVVICHGSVTGSKLKTILEQINRFVEVAPGELLLLDFQELKDECEEKVVKLIQATIWEDYIVPKALVNTELTFEEIRENNYRIIIFWNSKNTCNKDYLTPRNKGIWSPYEESIYKGSTSNIPAFLDERKRQWKKSHPQCFFVAQAISTPAINPPKVIEKRDGKILNNWVYKQKAESPVNIIMRDYINWYPDTIYEIVRKNLDRGNIPAKYSEIFALMGGAKQIPAMTQRSETLQAGSRYFAGSREICNEVFKRDYEFAKWQTHTWNIKCPEGHVITWMKIRSHWTDGTNGAFTIIKGGILQGLLEIRVESERSRGCHWSLRAEAAPINEKIFWVDDTEDDIGKGGNEE